MGLEFFQNFPPASFGFGLEKNFPKNDKALVSNNNGAFGPANVETDIKMIGISTHI
jgi:hypothetical protein